MTQAKTELASLIFWPTLYLVAWYVFRHVLRHGSVRCC